MSKQSVADFLTKLDEDAELLSRLKDALQDADDQPSRITEVAGEAGFEFSVDDYIETIDAICEPQEGELNNAELDALAGGGGVAPPPPSPPGPSIPMRSIRLLKGGFFEFNR